MTKNLKFGLNRRRNPAHDFAVNAVSLLVALYGLYDIAGTLLEQFMTHRLRLLSSFTIDVHLLLGLGFIYLSMLLARRKRNALIVSIVAFIFMFGIGTQELFGHSLYLRGGGFLVLIRLVILPVVVTAILLLEHHEFMVKSDSEVFTNSLVIALIALMITMAYGIAGFMLMDKTDFHREIGFNSALHHTIDQFDLTTNQPLKPYTKRASLFMDSLSFISVVSIIYVAISLFNPVRARFFETGADRERLRQLMKEYGAPSEDFFKLWPLDKHYFFSSDRQAGLAYQVRHGIALVLADPVGKRSAYKELFLRFHDLCLANDWQPALIHIDSRYAEFYKDMGYQLQLIGQEAVLDITRYTEVTAKNKYFRNIRNRFIKDNYSVELLTPPHHGAVVERLRAISDEWLDKPGRVERGFVMGYFDESYLQQCQIALVRDAAQTIQAFLNIIPSASFNQTEATYDMLRGTKDAPPNINDFLLLETLYKLKDSTGLKKFNLGLCPLVGLDENTKDNSMIGSVLRFAYVNGDRFYSFSGLHRFKNKYDPQWADRYLAYRGGVRGFSKMLNALVSAMKVRKLNRELNRRTHRSS